MRNVSSKKIKNFKDELSSLVNQEFEVRAKMQRLYRQFALDVENDKIALRHLRQAFFRILKSRAHKQFEDDMEFHPFFGNPEDDDDLI